MHFHRLHALVHVYFQHLEAMRIDNSSGAGSNREIFISQATFDSSWRGLAVYDNSYVDIAGNPYRALLRLWAQNKIVTQAREPVGVPGQGRGRVTWGRAEGPSTILVKPVAPTWAYLEPVGPWARILPPTLSRAQGPKTGQA